jgi:hypothetical protein
MTGTSLFWGAAVIAVVLTAELTGARVGVYAGAAGGLVLAVIGTWFAGRAAAAEVSADEGNRKAWSWWGYGLLSRTVALVALALLYRAFWGASEVVVPVLTMTGLYLAWLFWDVVRLYRQAGVSGKGHG